MKPRLDRLYADFNHPDSATDPIQIVRRFERPDDREVVGFCAAALAFGRVASVLQSIERLLAIMGDEPAAYVRGFDPRAQKPAFAGIVHRWTRGPDLVALVWMLKQMIDRAGSIEGFFLEGYDPAAPDVSAALDSFSRRALALDLTAAYGRGVARRRRAWRLLLFPRPSAGSACKRLNLFLRWMVRRDALDLGVWTRVAPAKLIVPLDTHVIRVGRCLRLTRYTSPGWRMARDITASLRRLDPADPVKYDFALCHLGMMNACGFNRAQEDSQCPLRGVCRPRARRRRGLRDHPLDGEALGDAREPASPIRCRSASSLSSRTIARAMARWSRGSTSSPLTPSSTTPECRRRASPRSRREQAIASSSEVPRPSVTELITNRSKPLMQPSTSVRNPGSSTCFSRWWSWTWRSRCSRSSPSPRMTNRASGISLHDQMRGFDQMPLALVRHQRGDVADDRRVMRQPERLVHVDRRRREDVLDVDAFVHRDRPLRGHAVGDQHLADRFGRGDEAVDLPMLPSRERVASDESRRGARRRAPAPAPATPSDSASDAIATPCGSCA